jgi:hypothetical protein
VSNTWEYKFAFHACGREDIPTEFRNGYDQLVHLHGQPVFGLFTPAVEESGRILSRWLPPRVIWLFGDSLAVASLDVRSDQVFMTEWRRANLLGYGLAQFLLHGWFSLYPNDPPEEKFVIRFPPQAARHFDELGTVLTNWCLEGERRTDISTRQPITLPGIPNKFASFLQGHPRLASSQVFFFQPAMELRGRGERRWANLLLLANLESIVVLSDQYRRESSPFGVELTFLPLKKVGSARWCESPDGHAAVLQVALQGSNCRLLLSWQIFGGLKPYALRFLEAVDALLDQAAHTRASQERVGTPGDEVIAANESLTNENGNCGDDKRN